MSNPNDVEGIIGFLLFVIFGFIFIGGFQWLAGKYAGASFHGKFGYSGAKRKSDEDEQLFAMLKATDPAGISKAIEKCKNKKFALTHRNILSEYKRLDNSM